MPCCLISSLVVRAREVMFHIGSTRNLNWSTIMINHTHIHCLSSLARAALKGARTRFISTALFILFSQFQQWLQTLNHCGIDGDVHTGHLSTVCICVWSSSSMMFDMHQLVRRQLIGCCLLLFDKIIEIASGVRSVTNEGNKSEESLQGKERVREKRQRRVILVICWIVWGELSSISKNPISKQQQQ